MLRCAPRTSGSRSARTGAAPARPPEIVATSSPAAGRSSTGEPTGAISEFSRARIAERSTVAPAAPTRSTTGPAIHTPTTARQPVSSAPPARLIGPWPLRLRRKSGPNCSARSASKPPRINAAGSATNSAEDERSWPPSTTGARVPRTAPTTKPASARLERPRVNPHTAAAAITAPTTRSTTGMRHRNSPPTRCGTLRVALNAPGRNAPWVVSSCDALAVAPNLGMAPRDAGRAFSLARAPTHPGRGARARRDGSPPGGLRRRSAARSDRPRPTWLAGGCPPSDRPA